MKRHVGRAPVGLKWAVLGALLVAIAFGGYEFIAIRGRGGITPAVTQAGVPITGAPIDGTALQGGGVQTIAVQVDGEYIPNVIHLKAGVPAELDFGRGQGCTSTVHSAQLNFSQDISAGPAAVKLPALQPGVYGFSCGMNMVRGRIVVK